MCRFLRFSCGILHLSLQKIELPSASQLVLSLCSVQVESCFTARLYRSGRIVPFSAATVGDCARILRHALGKCLCGSTPLIAWARAWRPSTEVKCVNGIWCVGSGKHLKLPSIHIHQAHAKQIKGMIKAALATWGPPALPRPKMRSWTLPAGITMLGHRKGQKFGWRKRDCTDCTCCCDDVLCSDV